jgi:hypothetical protein
MYKSIICEWKYTIGNIKPKVNVKYNEISTLPFAVRRSRNVSSGERRSAEGNAAMPEDNKNLISVCME